MRCPHGSLLAIAPEKGTSLSRQMFRPFFNLCPADYHADLARDQCLSWHLSDMPAHPWECPLVRVDRKSPWSGQTDANDPNRKSLHPENRAESGCPVTKKCGTSRAEN